MMEAYKERIGWPGFTVELIGAGPAGKSAYAYAVEAGYSGSEAEFSAVMGATGAAAILTAQTPAEFPESGSQAGLYLAAEENRLYRWDPEAGRYHCVGEAVRLQTAAEWQREDPIPAAGALGLETDTGRFKFGDGVSVWSALPYADAPRAIRSEGVPDAEAAYEPGTLWINTTTGTLYLRTEEAAGAAGWKQLVTPDQLAEVGAGDMLMAQFAANERAAEGYVDKALCAETLTGTFPASRITGLGTAAAMNAGAAPGNLPILGADGVLAPEFLPAGAIPVLHEADSEAGMQALAAYPGDLCIRTDESQTYLRTAEDWAVLPAAVRSVNGRIGAVQLSTDELPEGSVNHYFTEARFEAQFAAMMAAADLILDGGNA